MVAAAAVCGCDGVEGGEGGTGGGSGGGEMGEGIKEHKTQVEVFSWQFCNQILELTIADTPDSLL